MKFKRNGFIQLIFQLSVGLLCFFSFSIFAATESPQVIWTAVFSNLTPLNEKVSQLYCESHAPSVIVTTIAQITSRQGVRALNGVTIRYLSYKTIKKDNLYFNIVNAVVSGTDQKGKVWAEPMKLYEQTLAPVGVTYTVWSTANCKGTFLGTPTVV